MAIMESVCVHWKLYGDGETTKAAINLSGIAATSPAGVRDVSVGGTPGFKVKSFALSGTTLNVEFDSAPPLKPFDLIIDLLFATTAAMTPKEQKAHDKAEADEAKPEAKEEAPHHHKHSHR